MELLVFIFIIFIFGAKFYFFSDGTTFLSLIFDYIDIYRFKQNKEPKYAYLNQKKPSLTYGEEELLKNNFSYYNNLSADKKIIFGYRVKTFIEDKQFIGMEEMKIDGKMILMIAATAVKITFGLRQYRFENFTIFRVYPQQFYSRLFNSYMYGGTSAYGVMSLAWDKFLYGFENTEDNINLGFHEFAHALIIYQQNEVNITSFRRYTAEYDIQAEYAKDIMRDDDFFREYAYTNDMEFFAVVVEHFFENPKQLQQTLPALYSCLTKMFLQNPAAVCVN